MQEGKLLLVIEERLLCWKLMESQVFWESVVLGQLQLSFLALQPLEQKQELLAFQVL